MTGNRRRNFSFNNPSTMNQLSQLTNKFNQMTTKSKSICISSTILLFIAIIGIWNSLSNDSESNFILKNIFTNHKNNNSHSHSHNHINRNILQNNDNVQSSQSKNNPNSNPNSNSNSKSNVNTNSIPNQNIKSKINNDDQPSILFNSEYLYAVVVDAGSTGSRVHVYKYQNKFTNINIQIKHNELIEIDFRNEEYKKFYPGLSSFENKATNKTAMEEYMKPLINFARNYVPINYRQYTPFFVLATAGLRKVRERSINTANNIMNTCYDYLETSEFMIQKSYIKIIEGTDEGLWGWITANYLNGELHNAVTLGQPSKANTKGVLEMGGESLQITFMPDLSDTKHDEQILGDIGINEIHDYLEYVNIAGIDFLIFTHSYMGIGMQAAQSSFDTWLIKQGERNKSPCYIKGDEREREIGQKVTWEGTGNFNECYNSLTNLISNNECKFKSEIEKLMADMKSQSTKNNEILQCSPNGVIMPLFDKTTKEFYYIENFYYTANVLKITDITGKNGEFLSSLKESGNDYCSLTKDTAIKTFPHASNDEISKTCFCAAWLSVIIDHGFKFNDYENYKVVRDINKVGIDWALGFLVQKSHQLFKSIENIHISGNENENENENGYKFGFKNNLDKLFTIIIFASIVIGIYWLYSIYYKRTRHGAPNPIERWIYKLRHGHGSVKAHQSYSTISQYPV